MDTKVAISSRADVVENLAAMVRYGEESAVLVGNFLEHCRKDLGWRKSLNFPRCFLWELAAILRIDSWQQSKRSAVLASDFPASSTLFDDLLRRFCLDPLSMCQELNATTCPLAFAVSKLWYQHCAWHAGTELGVDIVLPDHDIQNLFEILADFIWEHRHLSTNLDKRDEL